MPRFDAEFLRYVSTFRLNQSHGLELEVEMVFTIEPMLNAGKR